MRPLFFSRRDGVEIGSFNHGLGLVELNISDEVREVIADHERIKRYLQDQRELLRILLGVTSVIHEYRHYLDTFGTMSGLSLYVNRLTCVKNFLETGATLALSSIPWQLPLSKWADAPDCPAPVRKLRRLGKSFAVASEVFVAPFPRLAFDGHLSECWIEVPFQSTSQGQRFDIPAYPLSIGLRAEGEQDRPVTVVFPIGYETIVEGAAHAMSRSMIESWFPAVPREFMANYGPPKQFTWQGNREAYLQEIADSHEPYNATDFLVSKFLKTKGIDTFSRQLITRLTDISLALTAIKIEEISDSSTMIQVYGPGRSLITHLQAVNTEELKTGEVEYPKVVTNIYTSVLEQLKRGGDWHTVQNPDSFGASLRVWESFVAQNITVPLLRKRLDTKHACFYDPVESIDVMFNDGLPVVQVLNNQISFRAIPEAVRWAWATQALLGEIMQQVFSDARFIHCPRAHRMLPGMSTIDFSGGNCAKNEKLGCGSWVPGQESFAPRCLFTDALVHTGFIPIKQINGSRAATKPSSL